jgi:hypothetical protein
MNFPSIDIQGSILSIDLLGKIRSGQSTFQQVKNFSPAFINAKLKDESVWPCRMPKGNVIFFRTS